MGDDGRDGDRAVGTLTGLFEGNGELDFDVLAVEALGPGGARSAAAKVAEERLENVLGLGASRCAAAALIGEEVVEAAGAGAESSWTEAARSGSGAAKGRRGALVGLGVEVGILCGRTEAVVSGSLRLVADGLRAVSVPLFCIIGSAHVKGVLDLYEALLGCGVFVRVRVVLLGELWRRWRPEIGDAGPHGRTW
jgi:hypothetical protein